MTPLALDNKEGMKMVSGCFGPGWFLPSLLLVLLAAFSEKKKEELVVVCMLVLFQQNSFKYQW